MWKPTDDICIVFDDKTGEDRAPEKIDLMVDEMREIANKYNFDLSMWGTDRSLFKALNLRFKTF